MDEPQKIPSADDMPVPGPGDVVVIPEGALVVFEDGGVRPFGRVVSVRVWDCVDGVVWWRGSGRRMRSSAEWRWP